MRKRKPLQSTGRARQNRIPELILIIDLNLVKELPDVLIPLIEESMILGNKLLQRIFLRLMRYIAVREDDISVLVKYLEYQLSRLSPKKGLKLLRWVLRRIRYFYDEDWEVVLLRAKLFLIAAKLFLRLNHVFRAQHYAFLTINELMLFPEHPLSFLLRADACNVLAEVYFRRRYMRNARYYSLKAMRLLEEWLERVEGVSWGRYALRLFVQAVNLTLKRIHYLSSPRMSMSRAEKVLNVLSHLADLSFLWRYVDLDVIQDLHLTIRDIEWMRGLPEDARDQFREYRYLIEEAMSKIRSRDSFFRGYYRYNLLYSYHLLDIGMPEEAFKRLKKLFVFSKYVMGSWRHLLVTKYAMFKVLYRYDLEDDLIRYLTDTDAERYISEEEARVPTRVKVIEYGRGIGTDGVMVPLMYSVESLRREYKRYRREKPNAFSFKRTRRSVLILWEEGSEVQ